jgi:putative restriction endonuclease
VRRGQAVFARVVRSNYASACAICGIDLPDLLVASHIKPWADDLDHRLDPANGLCLCALHDRLFDRGLITFSSGLRVRVSKELESASGPGISGIVDALDGARLRVPTQDPPDERMLDYHRRAVFRGN